MKQTITFLLFGPVLCPGGGMKIILEYSNRLVEAGYRVNIVYPATINWKKRNLTYKFKSIYHYFLHEKRGWKCNRWFDLDPRVKEFHTWSLDFSNVPKSDIYIATEVRTAPYVAKYPISESQKYYFIQGYENWNVSDEEVRSTYLLPLQKIVISNWLFKIVHSYDPRCKLIYNGFDNHYFYLDNPIENRNPLCIGFLYNSQPLKNMGLGFNIIERIKAKYPNVHIKMYGTEPRPETLPQEIDYYQRPDKKLHLSFYNDIAIFVGTSDSEGWGLPIGEAMMCGAAVACTDNQGYIEMATHLETALVSPVGDAEALANNIITLIENDKLRYKIAKKGIEFIKQFTWENSFNSMQKALGLKPSIEKDL